MLRLLLLAAFVYLAFRLVGILQRRREIPRPAQGSGVETFRDPVCGVYVSKEDAIVGRLENGEKMYFCSMECLDSYRESLGEKTHESDSGGKK